MGSRSSTLLATAAHLERRAVVAAAKKAIAEQVREARTAVTSHRHQQVSLLLAFASYFSPPAVYNFTTHCYQAGTYKAHLPKFIALVAEHENTLA